MNMVSMIGMRRCDVFVDGLKAELGSILSERILEAEAPEFLWEGRVSERYLGEQFALDTGEEGAMELSRIAILSFLDRRWHVGSCLVDGEGNAVELLWKRRFEDRAEAEIAFERAR